MSKTTKTPKTAKSLNERAMLIDLSIGFWEGRKKDNEVIEKVTKSNHADGDAGWWWTRAVPRAALRKVHAARNAAREAHLKWTLPWNDGGIRVLPAAMFFEYTEAMRKFKDDYAAAVEEFLSEYPTLVKDAQDRLGGLYKDEWFPTVNELRNRFPWNRRIMPLPEAKDFRVDLGAEVTADVVKEIEAMNNEAMTRSMNDLWERLHELVQKIADKLADPEGIFRDSMIENAKALCELLPKMNVTGDPNLEKMRAEVLVKIASCDPDTLRDNTVARQTAATAASKILETMKQCRV